MILLIASLILLPIITTILVLTSLPVRYGHADSTLAFSTHDIPIRSKFEKWRFFLSFVNFFTMNAHILSFIHKYEKYDDEDLMENLQFSFTINGKGKQSDHCIIFDITTLSKQYIIVVDIKKCFELKCSGEEFAKLLIHEYRHLWLKKNHLTFDDVHVREEWNEI